MHPKLLQKRNRSAVSDWRERNSKNAPEANVMQRKLKTLFSAFFEFLISIIIDIEKHITTDRNEKKDVITII
jgi:hypothetical protein